MGTSGTDWILMSKVKVTATPNMGRKGSSGILKVTVLKVREQTTLLVKAYRWVVYCQGSPSF